MSLNLHIIGIDVQNDFVDPNGGLYVKGGEQNAARAAKMIDRLRDKITDIHLTMDSHHKVDISHPLWWVDGAGKHPAPFTMITPEDVEQGKWRPHLMSARDRSLKYLKALRATNRYPHVIWPEHCLIGDPGHNIFPTLAAAVHEWEVKRFALSDVVTKGSNPWTEHFSAVMAEVPDPEDPSTQVNRGLIEALEKADMVIWVGEALSHCLANTFRDVAKNFSDPTYVKKMVLCTDASSNVPGFENLGDTFVKEMIAKGMQVSTTKDILA
jgi:nicotinamidase/pyrazinamidase